MPIPTCLPPRWILLLAALSWVAPAWAHDPASQASRCSLALTEGSASGAAELLCQRAAARAALGDSGGALEDFAQALRLAPEEHGIWRARGMVLAELRKWRAARVDLQRYLEWHPEDAQARWVLGSVLWAGWESANPSFPSGSGAVRQWEQALGSLEDARPHHFVQLAEALAALGEGSVALECIDAGLFALDSPISVLEVGAKLAERQARFDLAAAYWDAAARKAPRLQRLAARAKICRALARGRTTPWVPSVPQRFALAPIAQSSHSAAPVTSVALPPVVDLIPLASEWRYLDNGSNAGSAWRQPGFDDSAWASGPGELGYGDGDEATVLSFGPNASNKYVTSYFRRSFVLPPGVAPRAAWFDLLRDDGAVVYLNGLEIHRSNLPATGPIGYQTYALSAIGGADETSFERVVLDPQWLLGGTNVLAVEIHQATANSSDISFELRLSIARYGAVSRGPYLQMGGTDRAVLRWQTHTPTDSTVWLGSAVGQLSIAAMDGAVTTDHTVSLTGLTPGTRYYYAVGRSQGMLVGNTADCHFQTAPPANSQAPVRIWAIGDSGTGNADAKAVFDAYRTFAAGATTDVWLMLGDNAYTTGTDSEYQTAVFETYPALLRQAFVWPTLGNHDAMSATSASESGVYYDVFHLPRQAECGGVASGTEAYYSFDHGPVHFVCLDSEGSSLVPTGPMLTWLQADLAQRTQRWTVAFWHHPPYTKGSHDSDSLTDSGGRMKAVRENVLPLLEAAGVDVVLSGHSHS
ncbi:MAG TPA: metallophosphoesterase [Planctomycetota bacterium]|nr:metallophosphoesterase [Planctomycetota bacterium]